MEPGYIVTASPKKDPISLGRVNKNLLPIAKAGMIVWAVEDQLTIAHHQQGQLLRARNARREIEESERIAKGIESQRMEFAKDHGYQCSPSPTPFPRLNQPQNPLQIEELV